MKTSVNEVARVLASVATPVLAAGKKKLEAQGFAVKDTSAPGLPRVSLLISRPPRAVSVSVGYYWNNIENMFERDINLSDDLGGLPDKLTSTLTPEMVEQALALGIELLKKANEE